MIKLNPQFHIKPLKFFLTVNKKDLPWLFWNIVFYSSGTGEWKLNQTDFSNVEQREIFGIQVPVISRNDLIGYKSMLQGDHQLVDIQAAQN